MYVKNDICAGCFFYLKNTIFCDILKLDLDFAFY